MCRLATHGDAEALTHVEGLGGAVWSLRKVRPGEELAEKLLRRRTANARGLEDHRDEYNTVTGAMHRGVTEDTFSGLIIRRSG